MYACAELSVYVCVSVRIGPVNEKAPDVAAAVAL